MRKYIITPALLAIVCMVMCHCTFNRKASVAANEYLIQGELANLPDSIVIGLYEEDGNILNCVLRDTLMNGQFSFRDTVSTTRKMLIMLKKSELAQVMPSLLKKMEPQLFCGAIHLREKRTAYQRIWNKMIC